MSVAYCKYRQRVRLTSLIVIGIICCLITWKKLDNSPAILVQDCRDPSAAAFDSPKTAPILFVGGYESSGTGLMRIILDAHPWVRCGAEPMVTMTVLGIKSEIESSSKKRAISAGIYPDAIDNATAAFVLELVKRMGPPAKLLCHKQPFAFLYLSYLGYLFPKAKFIHVFRDGRAAIASSITRGLAKSDNLDASLKDWDVTVGAMFRNCQNLGSERCISIRYERLVMFPEQEIRGMLDFLGVPWDPIVLKHETILANLTHLNPYEPSTVQFSRKIHTESLAKWAAKDSMLNQTFVMSAHNQSALLKTLGYADLGVPPAYERVPKKIPLVT